MQFTAVKMDHLLMMYMICKLRAVVRFLSARGEMAVNIKKILREIVYTEDLRPYRTVF